MLMKKFNSPSRGALSRRTFLCAAGATIGLPLLEAMTPSFVHAAGDEQRRRIHTVVHAQRRADLRRTQSAQALRKTLRPRQARGSRGERRGPAPGTQHVGFRRRPIEALAAILVEGRSAAHGPVLHV